VCRILQEDVIINKDANLAHRNLLGLPGITNYLRSLKTTDEREHFERHLRKYIHMYLPECPFEVCTTNRYTILTHEACVVARRRLSPGEPIRFLTGIQVEMTEKEEEELSSRTDFSIVISSRRKRPSLFLGPARFANHDCDSNARLSTSGPHGINIVARKHIEQGDEITVQYGENYFGENNCECLCASCEKAVRNGWDPKGPMLPDSDSDSDSEAETEDKTSRRASVKPRATPVPKTSGKLKRKREHDTPNEDSEDLDLPKKRGRWPKKTATEKNRPVKKEPKTSGARMNAPNTQASQSMMADWFARRSNGGLTLDEIEDDDDEEHQGTLDDLHKQFQIQSKPSQGGSGKHGQKKQSMFGKMLDLITGATSRSLSKLSSEIEEMNLETAKIMNVDVAEVPRHYRRSARNQARLAQVEVPSQRESPDYDMEQVESLTQGIDMSAIYALWSQPIHHQLPERTDANNEIQGKDKISKVTDKFAQTKPTPASAKNGRSKSNLRNVLNADDDDDDEIDIYEVPESPAPEENTRRPRGRAWKTLANDLPRHSSTRQVDTAQNSTDSSSMSSVFSTEGIAGEASSLSSTEQSPDRMDGFVAGNISQNIVDMYTTEPSPVNEDWEEERQLSDQRMKGWSRGRLPTRKSSRRTLQEPSTQPITSIELPTEVKKEEDDDDHEDCKRGPVRIPGDFHLTTALLCTPYHRWVECRNCDEFFVQAEAYLTRIACPRCERHSKLYGYHWPKTDREGKHDTEERVLDHRTIHRFIDPEDERMEKKGKKGLAEVIRERETSSRMESEGLGDSRFDRLRSSPRRSESRRKTRSSML
jgi:histone-lysine N-methyltransferase SUV420H